MDMLLARGQEIESHLRGQQMNLKSLEFLQRRHVRQSVFTGAAECPNHVASEKLMNQVRRGSRSSESGERERWANRNTGLCLRIKFQSITGQEDLKCRAAHLIPVVGQNQYLQLFATQLQHQDPLEPTKQEDFLAQLAQFSSVESLQNMNTQFAGLSSKLDTLIGVTQGNNSSLSALQTLNAGAGLLGKSVRYGSDSSNVGVVDQIKPDNGSILVRIGDQFVPIAIL